MEEYIQQFGNRKIAVVTKDTPWYSQGRHLRVEKGETLEVSTHDKHVFKKIVENGVTQWVAHVNAYKWDNAKGIVSVNSLQFDHPSRGNHFTTILKGNLYSSEGAVGRICVLATEEPEIDLFYSSIVELFRDWAPHVWKICIRALQQCCKDSEKIGKRFTKHDEKIFSAVLDTAKHSSSSLFLAKLRMIYLKDLRGLFETYTGKSTHLDEIEMAITARSIYKPSYEKGIRNAWLVKSNLEKLKRQPEPEKKSEKKPVVLEKKPEKKPVVLEKKPEKKPVVAPKPNSAPAGPSTDSGFLPKLPMFDITSLAKEKYLGVGGQATALLVKPKTLPHSVVLKIFFDLEEERVDIAGCLKEIQSLLKLIVHPNIVRIFGVACAREVPVGIVMEYCENGSLWDAIHDKSLIYRTGEIVSWSLQAASALSFIHQCNILHRDVKPANMLLSSNRKLHKVSDLGMTKAFPKGENSSQPRMSKLAFKYVMGTRGYYAPELDKKVAYNEKVDVYSFGVSIWEMVNRKSPQKSQWKSPGGSHHSSLNNLMAKMMNQDPEMRPTMQTVYGTIDKWEYEKVI